MPRGIPNEKPLPGQKTLMIKINEADYLKLEKLAADQYRTPPLQAGYLLKQVLAQVGQNDETAALILERARANRHARDLPRPNGEA